MNKQLWAAGQTFTPSLQCKVYATWTRSRTDRGKKVARGREADSRAAARSKLPGPPQEPGALAPQSAAGSATRASSFHLDVDVGVPGRAPGTRGAPRPATLLPGPAPGAARPPMKTKCNLFCPDADLLGKVRFNWGGRKQS